MTTLLALTRFRRNAVLDLLILHIYIRFSILVVGHDFEVSIGVDFLHLEKGNKQPSREA